MQHRHTATYPPPDVHPVPAASRTQPPLPRPDFLIIGLFALRLTKRLIETLDYYPERDVDLTWLTNFLQPYRFDYDLAKISGTLKHQYLEMYPEIISRMRRQPRYPLCFMQVNPVAPDRQGRTRNQSAITDGAYNSIVVVLMLTHGLQLSG